MVFRGIAYRNVVLGVRRERGYGGDGGWGWVWLRRVMGIRECDVSARM